MWESRGGTGIGKPPSPPSSLRCAREGCARSSEGRFGAHCPSAPSHPLQTKAAEHTHTLVGGDAIHFEEPWSVNMLPVSKHNVVQEFAIFQDGPKTVSEGTVSSTELREFYERPSVSLTKVRAENSVSSFQPTLCVRAKQTPRVVGKTQRAWHRIQRVSLANHCA